VEAEMPGFWDDLGRGLQDAGAILSPTVYQQQNQERQLMIKQHMAQQQLQQELMAKSIISGIQQGSIDPQQGQAQLQRLGMGGAASVIQPTRQALAENEISKSLGGLQPSELTDPKALERLISNIPPAALLQSGTGQNLLAQQASMRKAEEDRALRRQTLEENMNLRYDQLAQRADEAKQRAEDRRQTIEDRARYQAESLALRQQLGIIAEESRRQGIELRREMFGQKTDQTIQNKIKGPADSLVGQIDEAIDLVKTNPNVVGLRGRAERGVEFMTGLVSDTAQNPASDFRTTILDLQNQYRHSPLGGGNKKFKSDVEKEDAIVAGLGSFTNPSQVITQLTQLKNNILKRANAESGKELYQIDSGSPVEKDPLKAKVEASGKKYDPDNYEYKQMPDGSIVARKK
jgi:hypothetical protein